MNARTEKAIYNNYCAVLKSRRANSQNRNSRVSDMKQKARVITADRYNVRISVVKDIVRKFDEQRGITHEHSAPYLKKLELDREYTNFLNNLEEMKCSTCGITDEGDNLEVVRVRICEKQSGCEPGTSPYEYRMPDNMNPVFTVKCFKHWYQENKIIPTN